MYDRTPQMSISNGVSVWSPRDPLQGFIDALGQSIIQTLAVKCIPHSGFGQFGLSLRLKTYLHEELLGSEITFNLFPRPTS